MAQLIIDLVNLGGGVQTLLAPAVLAASTQGTSYDGQNLDVSTNAIVSVGAYGANTTNLQVQIEEYTGSAWAVIPGMVCTATTSNTQFVLRGQRTYEYLRANAVSVQGTTPSVACSVVLVSQGKFVNQSGGYDRSPSA